VLLFKVNDGEWVRKVTYLNQIWLILGCESPIGKISQIIPDADSTLFILNQELDIKNTYSGPKSLNIMTD
jgi:hypothetical protein